MITYKHLITKLQQYLVNKKQDNRRIVIYIVSTCKDNMRGAVKTSQNTIYILINLYLNETKKQVVNTIIHEIAHVVTQNKKHNKQFKKTVKELKLLIREE